jgi:hypothetical protein
LTPPVLIDLRNVYRPEDLDGFAYSVGHSDWPEE